jgi:hypothetical protein
MYAPSNYGGFVQGGAGVSGPSHPSGAFNPNASVNVNANFPMSQAQQPNLQQQQHQHQLQQQQHLQAAQPQQMPQAYQQQQQLQFQQMQQMMYNPNQFGPGGMPPHQNPYGGMGINPGMMQNNNGMAHMQNMPNMPPNNGLGTWLIFSLCSRPFP